jgi:hypothetical protein
VTPDPIFRAFLARQEQEAEALNRDSDLVRLLPAGGVPGEPPDRYLMTLLCSGVVRARDGAVREAAEFHLGVWFPPDYLRRADPFEVLTWLHPRNVFHPNISDTLPVVCVGRLNPGTALVDLAYQCFEMVTYNKVTMREDDALNRAACAWARDNQHRFPLDRRPLKRRRLALEMEPAEGRAS